MSTQRYSSLNWCHQFKGLLPTRLFCSLVVIISGKAYSLVNGTSELKARYQFEKFCGINVMPRNFRKNIWNFNHFQLFKQNLMMVHCLKMTSGVDQNQSQLTFFKQLLLFISLAIYVILQYGTDKHTKISLLDRDFRLWYKKKKMNWIFYSYLSTARKLRIIGHSSTCASYFDSCSNQRGIINREPFGNAKKTKLYE